MSLNGNLKVGQSEDFFLNATQDGAPVAAPADVAYKVEPSAIGTVTKNAAGGTFKAVAPGSFTITSSDSEGDVPGTLSGVVASPLILALAWG